MYEIQPKTSKRKMTEEEMAWLEMLEDLEDF